MRDSLFRQQVFDEQRNRLLGHVLIQAPGLARGLFWLLTTAFIVSALFLTCGRYSRREDAIGILVPNRGAVKIQLHRTGLISAVHVNEGQIVEQNQTLFSLGTDRVLASGLEANQASIDELSSLIESLRERLNQLPQLQELELRQLAFEKEEVSSRMKLLRKQKILSQKQLDLKNDRQQRMQALVDDRLLSTNEFQEILDSVLQMQKELQNAEHAIIEAESRQQLIEGKIERLANDYHKQKVELLQQLNAATDRLRDLNLEKSQQIVAPVKGRITSLQAYPGMNIEADKPLAVLLPEGSQLEAHLFVPSRAIGFIKAGQRVLLQYEAFPAAKYGAQIGHVREISRTVLNAAEIYEMDLRGAQEAYYRLKVQIDKESIDAFGHSLPLQSGMKIKADIILEERTLLEWIFEPLLRTRGA